MYITIGLARSWTLGARCFLAQHSRPASSLSAASSPVPLSFPAAQAAAQFPSPFPAARAAAGGSSASASATVAGGSSASASGGRREREQPERAAAGGSSSTRRGRRRREQQERQPAGACDLGTARQVLARAVKAGVFADACVGTGFVRLYAELRLLEDAQKVFDCMPQRDLMSWNVLLDCYMKYGESGSCLQEFLRMAANGIRPDEYTFSTVLNDLAERFTGLEAMQIHSVILKFGYLIDLFLCNSLLNVYGRCGYVDLAKKLFDAMLDKDVVSWTALISGLSASGYQADAFHLFGQMRKASILPNCFSFGSVISSCACVNDLNQAWVGSCSCSCQLFA